MKGPFAKLSMGTLVSLVLITVTGVFLLGACLIVAIHRIQEGHVGVYFRNGRLIKDVSGPGKIKDHGLDLIMIYWIRRPIFHQ